MKDFGHTKEKLSRNEDQIWEKSLEEKEEIIKVPNIWYILLLSVMRTDEKRGEVIQVLGQDQ